MFVSSKYKSLLWFLRRPPQIRRTPSYELVQTLLYSHDMVGVLIIITSKIVLDYSAGVGGSSGLLGSERPLFGYSRMENFQKKVKNGAKKACDRK